jgi:hypothetical protein
MPREPTKEHKEAGEVVPYTPAQMLKRTAAYNVRMAIWGKTMQVGSL